MTVTDVHRGADAVPATHQPKFSVPIADRLDLRQIFAIFRRRFRLFFYTAIVVFDVAVLLAIFLPPRYTATASVVLNTHDTPVTPTSQVSTNGLPNSSSDVDTEIQILTSRALAAQVTDMLQLAQDPDIQALLSGGLLNRAKRAAGLARPPLSWSDPASRPKIRDAVISYIIGNLEVARLSSAYALSIAYSDPKPVRAATIANAFAHIYSHNQLVQKRVQNRLAAQMLGMRIAGLQRQAQSDFAAVQNYRVGHNLLSTTGATLTEQEISAYNQQVATAKAEAVEDAARLATARTQLTEGSIGDDVGEALSSPVVHALRAQRAQLSARFADYAGRYGPRNPDLMDTLRQLTEVDAQIQAEINRTISNLDAKAKVSRQHLASIEGSLDGARGTLASNNEAMVKLDDLQRRANTSQAVYDSYLNRYKEVVAAGGAEQPDSRLVSDALVPGAPSFPRPTLFLALGALLGIGLGLVFALIAEITFAGLTTSQEVEERLGVPAFGSVPELRSVTPRADSPLETMQTLPRSPLAEAIRGVLAAVRQGRDPGQIVMVSSALPNEGKTTVAACLAQAASIGAERVIVVDCDTIRRQYSKLFSGVGPRRPGLREVLAGTAPLADAIVSARSGSGVCALPITTPFERDELLIDKSKLQALLTELRARFDLIILDTAPILPVAETRELAPLADRILIVGRWRHTPDKAMISAIRLLPAEAQARIGVALTRVDMRKQVSFGYGDASSFYDKYKSYYAA